MRARVFRITGPGSDHDDGKNLGGSVALGIAVRVSGTHRQTRQAARSQSAGRAHARSRRRVLPDRVLPTVNANGLVFGTPEESTDYIPVLDPIRHIASEVKHPVRDPKTPSSAELPHPASPYWGENKIWENQTSMHNPMFDERARVWFTARVRPPENPAFCRAGSSHPSAKAFPVRRGGYGGEPRFPSVRLPPIGSRRDPQGEGRDGGGFWWRELVVEQQREREAETRDENDELRDEDDLLSDAHVFEFDGFCGLCHGGSWGEKRFSRAVRSCRGREP
jgi:hypothetical protein